VKVFSIFPPYRKRVGLRVICYSGNKGKSSHPSHRSQKFIFVLKRAGLAGSSRSARPAEPGQAVDRAWGPMCRADRTDDRSASANRRMLFSVVIKTHFLISIPKTQSTRLLTSRYYYFRPSSVLLVAPSPNICLCRRPGVAQIGRTSGLAPAWLYQAGTACSAHLVGLFSASLQLGAAVGAGRAERSRAGAAELGRDGRTGAWLAGQRQNWSWLGVKQAGGGRGEKARFCRSPDKEKPR
jgi:hypothetical protein